MSQDQRLSLLATMSALGMEQMPAMGTMRRVQPPKKCFRHDCKKPRNGNKLYCSAECCAKDQEDEQHGRN